MKCFSGYSICVWAMKGESLSDLLLITELVRGSILIDRRRLCVLNLLLVSLAVGCFLVQSYRSIAAISSTNELDPEETDQLANEQTDHADGQTNEDTSHDRDENGDNTHKEGVSKSMSVVRTVVAVMAVGTLVAGRTVGTHVWRHAALQLAVALGIWWAEVRSNVARHLVRWTSLVTAASTELAKTGVLCSLELLVNSV